MAGDDGELPAEATLGLSKGLVGSLTARARTSCWSPSQVDVLCSGQSLSTQSSSWNTFFVVMLVVTIILHMAAAALQAQSSVSLGFWPQHQGPGNRGGPGWPPALALPAAPRRRHPAALPLRAAGG